MITIISQVKLARAISLLKILRIMGRYVNITKKIKMHDTLHRAPDKGYTSVYVVRNTSSQIQIYRNQLWKKVVNLIYFFFFCAFGVAFYTIYQTTKKC